MRYVMEPVKMLVSSGVLEVELILLESNYKGVYFNPHGFPSWLITHFHTETMVELHGEMVPIPAESLVILPPHTTFKCGAEGHVSFRSGMRVAGDCMKDLLASLKLKTNFPVYMEDKFKTVNVLTDIVIENQQLNPDERSLGLLFEYWLRCIKHKQNASLDTVPMEYQDIKIYLERNCNRNLSLKKIANEIGIDKNSFCRNFKQYFGETPIAFVNQRRLNLAADLLYDHNLSVSDVAYATGYSDLYQFSKAFKKFYGISPSVKRKQISV